MNTLFSADHKPIKLWAEQSSVEPDALKQLRNTASLPIVAAEGIAVMPDVHFGIGATVGSVVPTIGAIIPAAVGVDIGCGMAAFQLGIKADALEGMLPKLRSEIERLVPVGAGNQSRNEKWTNPPQQVLTKWGVLAPGYQAVLDKHPKIAPRHGLSPVNQLGTLGGGNHFIEVCLDQDNQVWVMLHSGSRGIGNIIGRYFIEQAKAYVTLMGISVPDKDLAYLPDNTAAYMDYCEALSWAQTYASVNRRAMREQILTAFESAYGAERWAELYGGMRAHLTYVTCHHNYVSWERHFGQDMIVTRKGAVRAGEGDFVIIPGSMGAKSFIAKGLGNAKSYNSCSHGAGRRMSRGAAKRTFTVADLISQTAGVECRKDEGVLDEIPGCYKDIDAVMEQQSDLITPVYTLKQVLCVKG